uniref:(northern house mosquito) hypothetical protein n=1 Tax=Culex pipiens TaxID=7175 RepID=A0A8D8A9J5_CULPI
MDSSSICSPMPSPQTNHRRHSRCHQLNYNPVPTRSQYPTAADRFPLPHRNPDGGDGDGAKTLPWPPPSDCDDDGPGPRPPPPTTTPGGMSNPERWTSGTAALGRHRRSAGEPAIRPIPTGSGAI